MIIVTRPESVDRDNDQQISINEQNINVVESLPEDSGIEGGSKITMVNDQRIIVKESVEEVNRLIKEAE